MPLFLTPSRCYRVLDNNLCNSPSPMPAGYDCVFSQPGAESTRRRRHRILHPALEQSRRQRARQLPALSQRTLHAARPATARARRRRHARQRLRLRAPRRHARARWQRQQRLHRPLPARLFCGRAEADRQGARQQRLGQGDAARAQPGRPVRACAACRRRPAAFPDDRRRRPQHRALRRIQPLRRDLHALPRRAQPPPPPRRPAPRRHPRAPARGLARPDEPRPIAAVGARHPRHRGPASRRWPVRSKPSATCPSASPTS